MLASIAMRLENVLSSAMYSSPLYDLYQLVLIAVAYRPFGQAYCRTGKRPASLGEQALSGATPDLRSADLHLTVVGPQYRKAIACPTPNLT